MKTILCTRSLVLTILLAGFVAGPAAFAGIPEPPILIFGTLQTSGGLPVTSGELRFDFVPVGGGTTVRVMARVGSLSENFTFAAIVPNERSPVAQADKALELGSGKTYTPRAYYNGIQITPVQIESPLTPERAKIIGPIIYTVSPTGKVISVSHDIDFGFVPVGSYSQDTFQISNVGTEVVAGLAQLEKQVQFKIMVGTVPISQVAINLNTGEFMDVTVRFEPGVASDNLTDIFQVRTDGGDVDRTVIGSSITEGPSEDIDFNDDDKVDKIDVFVFLKNWYLRVPNLPNVQTDLDKDDDADEEDLLRFLDLWSQHQQQ
jgi:hypothetical protein